MLDLTIVAVLVVFGIMGLVSGMLFQVLRLGAVVVSVLIGLQATGPLMQAFPALERLPAGGEGLVPAGLFLVFYLLLSIVCRLIVKAYHAVSPTHGAGDRLLGGVFSVLKGAVLCYFIVAILLAAEATEGRPLRLVDTHQSVAADLVRRWPMGRLADLLDSADLEALPRIRDALKVDRALPPPPDVEATP